MSDYQPKDNSGTAFWNNDKKSDQHPDIRGTVMVGGQIYDVSVWKKQSKKGEFFSLSFRHPVNRNTQPTPQQAAAMPTARPASRDERAMHQAQDDDFNDEILF